MPATGFSHRYTLKLALSGQMVVERRGEERQLPVKGEANHTFTEYTDRLNTSGHVDRALRHYEFAKSVVSINGEGRVQELPAVHRTIAVSHLDSGRIHHSMGGPLTRDELDLVAQHFDVLCLAGCLPGKDVTVMESWKLSDTAVQQACLFDGLLKQDVQGTLLRVTGEQAVLGFRGSAEGLEAGAGIKVKIDATATYDIKAKRITGVQWRQDDTRELGPATPAMTITAKIDIVSETLPNEPKELSAEVREKAFVKPTPSELLRIRHTEPSGAYTVLHSRDWRNIGATSAFSVFRLLQGGEFIAQATVTAWTAVGKGEHTPASEIVAAINKTPGWVLGEVLSEGEQKSTNPARWVYRYSARGKRDGAEVIQTFDFISVDGKQALVSFLVAPDKVKRLAEVEADFVDGVSPGVRK